MQNLVETTMYQLSQIFLLPTLALIAILFLYAFWVLGQFGVLAWLRRKGGGRPLLDIYLGTPQLSEDQLDLLAHKQLENARIASRVTPMLGLVATMIPMGPALKSLSDGNLAKVSDKPDRRLLGRHPGVDRRLDHLLGGQRPPALAGRRTDRDPGTQRGDGMSAPARPPERGARPPLEKVVRSDRRVAQ